MSGVVAVTGKDKYELQNVQHVCKLALIELMQDEKGDSEKEIGLRRRIKRQRRILRISNNA